MLALTYPEAVMLLEVVLVKMAIGLVTDVTALITLALTYPEAVMLLEEMAVKMPIGLVTEVTASIVLALTYPLALILPPITTAPVFTVTIFDLEPTAVPFPMMKRSCVFELVMLNFPDTCW